MNAKQELPKLETLPQPSATAEFSLQRVEKVSMPHPYCITARHVSIAADRFGGMLTVDAIRYAEKSGACCGICQQQRGGILSYDQHENLTTLFIRVPQNHDLNLIEGLNDFLVANKQLFVDSGIEGFAFPTK